MRCPYLAGSKEFLLIRQEVKLTVAKLLPVLLVTLRFLHFRHPRLSQSLDLGLAGQNVIEPCNLFVHGIVDDARSSLNHLTIHPNENVRSVLWGSFLFPTPKMTVTSSTPVAQQLTHRTLIFFVCFGKRKKWRRESDYIPETTTDRQDGGQ